MLNDLKLLESNENHTKNLRQRWVLGSREWMSGKHGSLQNLKEVFGYSDNEWDFIWSKMIQEGAWNVSGILDEKGNEIKANYAPEIMIKFIAHDLRCHIVIFDLLIGTIQYCSGNYLKENNVVFDSPLLLYATGNHFQSVLPTDEKAFVSLAKRLENESKGIIVSQDKASLEEREAIKTESTVAPCQAEYLFDHEDLTLSQPKNINSDIPLQIKPSVVGKDIAYLDANTSRTNICDNECFSEDLSLDQLRSIKNKTPYEQKLYDKLRKRVQRQNKAIPLEAKHQVVNIEKNIKKDPEKITVSDNCLPIQKDAALSDSQTLDQLKQIRNKTPSQKKGL